MKKIIVYRDICPTKEDLVGSFISNHLRKACVKVVPNSDTFSTLNDRNSRKLDGYVKCYTQLEGSVVK